MFVSGFTFVRNASLYDYPLEASIESLLPLVDELVVAVGKSDDDTRQRVVAIADKKIKIIDTIWDDSLRKGGKVLAAETNKAFDAISPQADWCIYLQADEVLHEQDYTTIRNAMQTNLQNKQVEGLLFSYHHFYGNYQYVGDSRRWYRHEIRIIRNDKQIRSYRDAQGFRKNDNKLKVKKIQANVYHYGWVKDPRKQQAKQETFNLLWHDENWMEKHIAKADQYDYAVIDSLTRFEGTHPKTIQSRIDKMNWQFDWDTSQKKFTLKNRLLYFIEKTTGVRLFEYKNYEQM
jgi:glycosyltransferase involved in cell wall biosynthesis